MFVVEYFDYDLDEHGVEDKFESKEQAKQYAVDCIILKGYDKVNVYEDDIQIACYRLNTEPKKKEE